MCGGMGMGWDVGTFFLLLFDKMQIIFFVDKMQFFFSFDKMQIKVFYAYNFFYLIKCK